MLGASSGGMVRRNRGRCQATRVNFCSDGSRFPSASLRAGESEAAHHIYSETRKLESAGRCRIQLHSLVRRWFDLSQGVRKFCSNAWNAPSGHKPFGPIAPCFGWTLGLLTGGRRISGE